MCYDNFNDRLFLVLTDGTPPPTPYIIWDCATRAIIQVDTVPNVNPAYCAYANVTNKYYVTNAGNTRVTMSTVDALTYATGSTNSSASSRIYYVSESKLMANTNYNNPFIFIDPLLDSVRLVDPTLGNSTVSSFEFGGAVYDPCSNLIVVGAVTSEGSKDGLACFDATTLSASNWIDISNDTSYVIGGMCFVETGSRIYVTMDDDSFPTRNVLYSSKISVPTGSIIEPPLPVTASSGIAWWTFDDSPTGPWVDAVSGVTSLYGVSGTVTTASGLVTSSLNMISSGGSVNIFTDTSSVELNYSSSGFTIVTWMKIDVRDSVGIYYYTFNSQRLGGVVTGNQSAFTAWLYSSPTDVWELSLDDSGSNTIILDQFPFTPNLGEWYLLRFSYDYSLGKMIFQVNTGSQVTGSTTFSYYPSASTQGNFKLRSDPTSDIKLDEMNFSNYVLSNAEIAHLYNSGSGVSYA